MNVETIIFSSILLGSINAYLANRRGRNPYLWFLAGFIFGLFGIISFFLMTPPVKKAEPLPKLPPQPYIDGPVDRFWYYLDPSRERHGPMSFQALTDAWKKGTIGYATFVWHEELTAWKPLQEMIRYRESDCR